MYQFNGILIGGPDDGNSVTATQNRIPVTSTTELWLDGKGKDSSVSIIETHGEYIWDEDSHNFIWHFKYNKVFIKKVEIA
jgi:hypothetical protein